MSNFAFLAAALAFGGALSQALGDRKGIHRFGDFSAPLDEALVHVVLVISFPSCTHLLLLQVLALQNFICYEECCHAHCIGMRTAFRPAQHAGAGGKSQLSRCCQCCDPSTFWHLRHSAATSHHVADNSWMLQDLSGRPHLGYDLQIPTAHIGTYDTQLVEHFFQSVVNTSGMTLHIRQLSGSNSHHIVEATFKAFARALRTACEVDPRRAGQIASSKGVLTQQ